MIPGESHPFSRADWIRSQMVFLTKSFLLLFSSIHIPYISVQKIREKLENSRRWEKRSPFSKYFFLNYYSCFSTKRKRKKETKRETERRQRERKLISWKFSREAYLKLACLSNTSVLRIIPVNRTSTTGRQTMNRIENTSTFGVVISLINFQWRQLSFNFLSDVHCSLHQCDLTLNRVCHFSFTTYVQL